MSQLNGWHQFEDSLGICRFDFTNAHLGMATVSAVSGYDIDVQESLQDRAADLGAAAGLELPARAGPVAGAAVDALRLDPGGRRPGREHHGPLGPDGQRVPEEDRVRRRPGLPLPETLRALDLEELIAEWWSRSRPSAGWPRHA